MNYMALLIDTTYRRAYRKYLLLSISLLIPLNAGAIVDMENLNFTDSWTDLSYSSSFDTLNVKRTYNSRSLFDGMFGFGWCSDFETKLTAEPGYRIVRKECGAGVETSYYLAGEYTKSLTGLQSTKGSAFFDTGLRSPSQSKDKRTYNVNVSELSTDAISEHRVESGNVVRLNSYYTRSGSISDMQRIFFDGELFVLEAGRKVYRYSLNGFLKSVTDLGTGVLKEYSYVAVRLVRIKVSRPTDSKSQEDLVNFEYGENGKVSKLSVGEYSVIYRYQDDQLVSVTNAWGNTYTYEYDNYYNLLVIGYPDGTTRKIGYDIDKDWVTHFTHRDGCTETYSILAEHEDYHSDKVVKECDRTIVGSSTYGFKFTGPDYSRLLFEEHMNSDIRIYLHPYYENLPFKVINRGETSRYYYDAQARLSGIETPEEDQESVSRTLRRYSGNCDKPSYVLISRSSDSGISENEVWRASYNSDTCKVTHIENSNGHKLRLHWGKDGKLVEVIDLKDNVSLTLQYNGQLNTLSGLVSQQGSAEFNLYTDKIFSKTDDQDIYYEGQACTCSLAPVETFLNSDQESYTGTGKESLQLLLSIFNTFAVTLEDIQGVPYHPIKPRMP
jgi:YD repeat-containing protein